MTATAKGARADAIMEKSMQALGRRAYFEAERLAHQALGIVREAADAGRIARILPALQEARRQRTQLAIDAAGEQVNIVEEGVTESLKVKPGCHIVRPPLVGADARRLRLMAFEQEVPVIVICHEPLTRLRLCPIVAIAPGLTLRTKIDPPDDPRSPSVEWLLDAMEALGDWAIDSLDSELTPVRRLDALLTRLEAVPEHELLHQAAMAAAESVEAEHRAAEAERASGGKPKRSTSRK